MLTRRAVSSLVGTAVVVTVVSALAGCASRDAADVPADGSSAGPAQVTVSTVDGEVEVDVTTEGIWALDEYAALQLLSLGVTPVGVGEYFLDPASAEVLTSAGVELSRASDLEVVAAAAPQLIVGTGHPEHVELKSRYEQLAPVVLPEFATPWTDQLAVVATVTGREDRAAAIEQRVLAFQDDLAADIAASPLAGASVSMLAEYSDGTFFAFDQTSLAGRTVEELGLTRPPTQVNDDDADFGFAALSQETLPDQGADVVLAFVEATPDAPSVLDNEVFVAQAEAAERTAEVESSVWSVATPLSAWWMLQDLRAVLVDGAEAADLSAATERWADLTADLPGGS